MRKIVLIFLLFLVKNGFCQLADNFTDNDLKKDPVWNGSNSGTDFIINAGLLQSNSTTLNSNFYLSTANALALNCSWEFWCNLKFNTSGANYADVYLTSDQQDLLQANINGYFLRIGNTDDDICLYKRSGALSTAVKLTDGVNGVTGSANNLLKIRIRRDNAGLFTIEWDTSGTGTQYVMGGNAIDLAYQTTAWFGISIRQSTAAFIQKHFFDDFIIKPLIEDKNPPVLTAVVPTDSMHVDLVFNEPIASGNIFDLQNYELDRSGNTPIAVDIVNASSLRLTYANALQTGNHEFKVNNLEDINANRIIAGSSKTFFYIKPYTARYGDVVINEIFADPSPVIGLPPDEFVELWNTSKEYIRLDGWKYEDLTSSVAFNNDTIAPGTYIILCTKSSEQAFAQYGKTIGFTNWLSLNNDKDKLKLTSADGLLIDEVAYKDDWYKNALKKQGGYSLERIDPANICTGIQNWQASNDDSGGTPGRENSVYRSQQSTTKPALTEALLLDSVTIVIKFSKYIDSASAAVTANYQVNNGIGNPESAVPQSPDFTSVTLRLNETIKRDISHWLTLNVNGIIDCAGNIIDPAAREADLFLAAEIRPGDILISETLFNPKPGGVDFIEVYNNTDHKLDLSELQIATADPAGKPANLKNLSTVNTYIEPGTYWVLTSDPERTKTDYLAKNEENFIKVSLPAYKVAAGSVILLSKEKIIDWFDYTEGMHTPLLKEVKGVALERITFTKPANEPGNFTSASATAGYATPTYKNSVGLENSASGFTGIKLRSRLFSPDNDGINDELEIEYTFNAPDKMGSINIYNDRGLLQRQLIKNHNLATNGKITWDGLDDNGQPCKIGIYILTFNIFDLNGKTGHYKKACVLARKR